MNVPKDGPREHTFPASRKLGSAHKFVTVYNDEDESWGWEAEYRQGKDYGYRTRADAIVGAVMACVAADPRPVDIGDLVEAVREYVGIIECGDDGEDASTFISIAWLGNMKGIAERLAAAPPAQEAGARSPLEIVAAATDFPPGTVLRIEADGRVSIDPADLADPGARGREAAVLRVVIVSRPHVGQAIRQWDNIGNLPDGEHFLCLATPPAAKGGES